jgi:hypothetical protein
VPTKSENLKLETPVSQEILNIFKWDCFHLEERNRNHQKQLKIKF